jgi:hypothetical protein
MGLRIDEPLNTEVHGSSNKGKKKGGGGGGDILLQNEGLEKVLRLAQQKGMLLILLQPHLTQVPPQVHCTPTPHQPSLQQLGPRSLGLERNYIRAA